MTNKTFKEDLRNYRIAGLTILQWMAVLAITGIVLNIILSLFF